MRWELANSFILTRRYEEAVRIADGILTIWPDYDGASRAKALIQFAWKGDTTLAKQVLRDEHGCKGCGWAVASLLWADPREGLSFLDSVDSDPITGAGFVCPKALLYAITHEALGDADRARKEYEMALPLLIAEVQKNSKNSRTTYQRSLLARAYAGLGRKEDALREARRAVELVPISKDALVGADIEIERAAVEARVGETDAAIEHIRHLLSIPCSLSPALLRIDPQWAPLRDDPRFRKLAELE
jgi:serine/threonine-protein kinase